MFTTREVLLVRSGLVFLDGSGGAVPQDTVRALDVELAALGFIPSVRLARRIAQLPRAELARLHSWLCTTLSASLGADRKHEPLFRTFPDGIPPDTFDLWLRKVVTQFWAESDQPCPLCSQVGTTHVLSPCYHVVCDRCFDGASYSACPVCEHAVDRASPFFEPSPARGAPEERVRFKLIDLGDDLEAAARALFDSLLARKAALSPTDRDALAALLADYRMGVVAWLPLQIPVRENIAHVFGTLLRHAPAAAVMEVARRYLGTVTDVLRLIAAYSGADPALQRETKFHEVEREAPPNRWAGRILALLGIQLQNRKVRVQVPIQTCRFKVGKLARAQRRELLKFLEGLPRDALIEDMLRHRSYWVWLGEFLHPHEYARRYPITAHAFQIVRRNDPEGRRAPKFYGWKSRVESSLHEGDVAGALALLQQRPGELARRFDHALRLADAPTTAALLEAFDAHAPDLATPVLLTLRNHFPLRGAHRLRVYWPKGQVSKGVSAPDTRPLLTAGVIARLTRTIERELLRRFGAKPEWDTCVIDDALGRVIAPFNERTASRAAVSLPRGTSISVPMGKTVRMFLHWCQPEIGGITTDVDLSVAFYDADWNHAGVCSYYNLTLGQIATSSGDLRDAPFPEGATEFVDVSLERARAAGIRYAVMVVNNYAGMAFSALERGWAGYMLRDDAHGAHFDPRTVEHRFALAGENGVYMPLVIDLAESQLHWLDTYSKGQLAFNNVANANKDISRICPERIAYFASGARMSMRELALLHAAARARAVLLRGDTNRLFERRAGEDAAAFLARLTSGAPDRTGVEVESLSPAFAALFRGDLTLPEGAACYAVFRDQTTPLISASDLIA